MIFFYFQTFGNHEFDDGIGNLVQFLEEAQFPVVAANIEDSEEPSIQRKYAKSVVLEKEGRKIGVVGYVTPETLVLYRRSFVTNEKWDLCIVLLKTKSQLCVC